MGAAIKVLGGGGVFAVVADAPCLQSCGKIRRLEVCLDSFSVILLYGLSEVENSRAVLKLLKVVI